jgi:hypothetical protein
MTLLLIACGGAPIELEDAHNFSYEATLDPPTAELAELADSEFVWDGLETDLLDQDLDPGSITELSIAVFDGYELAELLDLLIRDELPQSALSLYVSAPPNSPARFSDFGLQNDDLHPEQYFEVGSGTWLMAWTSGDETSSQTERLLLLEPTPDGPTTATLPPRGGELEASADFLSLTPLRAPEGAPEVDWSGLTRDAQGGDLPLQQIDLLRVSWLPETDLDLLGREFVELESRLDKDWRLPLVSTVRADLAELEGDEPFTGFTDEGTWLLSLSCERCSLPVPSFVTVVERD